MEELHQAFLATNVTAYNTSTFVAWKMCTDTLKCSRQQIYLSLLQEEVKQLENQTSLSKKGKSKRRACTRYTDKKIYRRTATRLNKRYTLRNCTDTSRRSGGGVGLRPLACWGLRVVCWLVAVSATGRFRNHRSPTECVCVCVCVCVSLSLNLDTARSR